MHHLYCLIHFSNFYPIMIKKLLFAAIIAMTAANAHANNVQVSGVSINGQNTTDHYSLIKFNIGWENAWRTNSNESNYDGCWVFVKFRKANTSNWQHATINYGTNGTAVNSGHTQPTGSVIRTPQDGKGVWVYKSGNGTGDVNYNNASLRWNYGADGVLDNDSVEVNVYAVEMVYCTQGDFYLGSGGTEAAAFRQGGTTATPYHVMSESAMTVGNASTDLYYSSTTYSGDQSGPIPAAYPKGYNAFWVMKYEASQQQYVDFMNALDATKAANRNVGSYVTGSANNYAADYPARAASNIGHNDNLAFLDWAGLRPITELEYEKACRGYNIMPVADEYAWGNTTAVATTGVYNTGTDNETNLNGNAVYYPFGSYLNRPIRTGAFANDTTDNRTETGGTYYGGMEMSGNCWEPVVNVGTAQGRSFDAQNGDGNLNAAGDADVANWSYQGMGMRGGAYNAPNTSMTVSTREYGIYNPIGRQANLGIRGGRTAE